MPSPDDHRMDDGEVDHSGTLPDQKVAAVPSVSKEELQRLLREVENAPLNENDHWFLVSAKWWKNFVNAVNQGFVDDIGPLDNSDISERTRNGQYFLRNRLSEGADFQTVPEPIYCRLREIFGLDDDERDYISRTVVSKDGSLIVEVYPRIVHISNARNRNMKVDLTLRPNDTMVTLRDRAIAELDLNVDEKVRFYVMNGENPELVDTSQSLDSYFDTAQNVLIDVEENGEYFFKTKTSPPPQPKPYSGSTSIGNGAYNSNFTSATFPGTVSKMPPGQCGLSNLGNTCFMASSIQCLSHMPAIREYFLSSAYLEDLNPENPLGTNGHLAQAVGELFKAMWSGNYSSVVPRKFKSVIGQFAPRFNGYSQQDSHELMAYVLDGLHEDLNRIKKKPYFEDNDELAKLPIHEYAEESWKVYKMRNDSIIVDTLHGQLKSTLICPVCAQISIKFDPFGYLSLPLPPKELIVKQNVVCMFLERKWAKFSVALVDSTTVREVEEMMKVKLQSEKEHYLVFFSLTGSGEVVLLRSSDKIRVGRGDNITYAAEVQHDPNAEGTRIVVAYNLFKFCRPCSLPFIHTIKSEKEFTRSFITGQILDVTSRFFFNKKDALEPSENEDDAMNGVIEEKEPYSDIMTSPELTKEEKSLQPGNEPIEWPKGQDAYTNYQKVTFLWKDTKLFNQYRGHDLVEREISVKTRKKVDLMETLDWFTMKEHLGEHDLWYCPNCKKHERASKQLDLWKMPEILILHLKRFQYTRWSREKLCWDVVIPVKGLDLTPKIANERHGKAVYDLIAISRHYGSLSGGHYTASALNDKIGRWCDYNDSHANLSEAPTDPYESSEPYMLVYKRRKLDKNGEPVENSDLSDEEMYNNFHRANNNKRSMVHHHDENLDVEMEED